MAYSTQADILKLISEADLAQLTAEAGEIPDAEVVSWAIAQADAEIDAYLGRRYTLPLAAPIPPRLTALSADLALYHCFVRRGNPDELRRQRYADAIAFLKDVAAGKAEIQGLDGIEPAGEAGEVTEISSATRVFSRDTLKNW